MSIKSALKAAVDAASTMLESPELPTGHDVLEQREAEISVLLERLKVAERINREYFEVIEAIERERDEWLQLGRSHSGAETVERGERLELSLAEPRSGRDSAARPSFNRERVTPARTPNATQPQVNGGASDAKYARHRGLTRVCFG